MDALDPHRSHSRSNSVAAHAKTFSPKDRRNPAAPEERPTGIDFVDPVPEKNLFCRRQDCLAIEAGTRDPQKRGLKRERKLGTVALDQTFTVAMAQTIPDFFNEMVPPFPGITASIGAEWE